MVLGKIYGVRIETSDDAGWLLSANAMKGSPQLTWMMNIVCLKEEIEWVSL